MCKFTRELFYYRRMTLADRIRQRIKELGTTAHAVSMAATDGRSKDLVANIYAGKSRNPRGDTLTKLADQLGVTMDWLLHGDGEPPPPVLDSPLPNVVAAPVSIPMRAAMQRNLPVLGTAAGSMAGAFQFDGGVIDYVMRPPALTHVKDAYGIYVRGSSMEPAHPDGELRFAHPHRPPQIGDDVVIVARYSSDGPMEAFIKRLVKRTANTIEVEQFNPPARLIFNRDFVETCHKVLTMSDLFGM